jgi:hypothetical protein
MSYTLSKNMSADGGWFHILKDGGTYLVLCRMLVVRLSRQGQVLWEKNCKDTNSAWEPLRWSELDEKASIYLTGDVDDHSRVLKIDSSGSIVWVREFNSPEKNRDQLLFLLQRKGDTYLAGWVMKDKVSTDQTRIIVARTDSLGNELWASEWGGADIAYPGYGSNWYEPEARPDYCSMNVDDSGNVYVTGWFGYSCSRSYCFGAAMLKYDARGSRVWVRKLPEQPREWWNGAIVGLDKKGALYDIGVERDSLPPYGIYVLKYRTR